MQTNPATIILIGGLLVLALVIVSRSNGAAARQQ